MKRFHHFFRELYSPLCLYAEQFVFDRRVAEEIVAGEFVKLRRKYGEWKDAETISAQLYGAVKNAAIYEFRVRGFESKFPKEFMYMYKDELEDALTANIGKGESIWRGLRIFQVMRGKALVKKRLKSV